MVLFAELCFSMAAIAAANGQSKLTAASLFEAAIKALLWAQVGYQAV
jgi:hypothetical protein